MAKRGKRANKIKVPGKRTRQDIRRVLRKAGSLEKYYQWGREEQEAIEREKAQEDFDKAFLPGLEFMEENFWKRQRSPEAKRIYRERALELGEKSTLLTREEILGKTIDALWRDPKKSDLDQIKDPNVTAAWMNWKRGLGQSKEAVKRRLIRKLRGRVKPPS